MSAGAWGCVHKIRVLLNFNHAEFVRSSYQCWLPSPDETEKPEIVKSCASKAVGEFSDWFLTGQRSHLPWAFDAFSVVTP